MSVIKEFPTAETPTYIKRKGRPRSSDPKVSVTLSIRRSTLDRITHQLPAGQSAPGALSEAVERKYGGPALSRPDPGIPEKKGTPPPEVTPRPKGSKRAS